MVQRNANPDTGWSGAAAGAEELGDTGREERGVRTEVGGGLPRPAWCCEKSAGDRPREE